LLKGLLSEAFQYLLAICSSKMSSELFQNFDNELKYNNTKSLKIVTNAVHVLMGERRGSWLL
jgi:hypothetical protein